MAEYQFRVNLLHDGADFQNPNKVLEVSQTKNFYLPLRDIGLPLKVLKHGDTFTLSGTQGYKIKHLVESGLLFHLEVVTEATEEEEETALNLLGAGRDGVYSLLFTSSFISFGGRAYTYNDEDSPELDLDEVDDVCVAYDGSNTFILIVLDNGEFNLLKVAENGTKTLIEIPEISASYQIRSSISDGLNDMYDDGNRLNTNLQSNIVYLHTANTADAEPVDGASVFGEGSQYVTNNYGGIFTLFATSMSITDFSITGNIGADGGGSQASGRLVVNVADQDFTVFYKRVYGASDPSVNHLIIIPGDHDLTQTIGVSTDLDTHAIEGMSVASRMAYLLFATANGGQVSNEEFENIAEAFITATGGFNTNSISDIMNGMAANQEEIIDLISDLVEFDDGDASEEVEGLSGLDSMTYVGDNKLAILRDNNYYLIDTTNGDILVNYNGEAYNSCSSLVYFEEQLYGFGFGNILYEINKNTGVVQGEGDLEDKKSNVLSWKEDSPEQFENIEGMYLPFVSNGNLYAVVEFDDNPSSLVQVFPETNEINYICRFDSEDLDGIVETPFLVNHSYEIGRSIEEFTEYDDYQFYFWNGQIYIDENLLYQTPTLENFEAQYVEQDVFQENDDPTWLPLEITEIVFDTDRWEISFTEPDVEYSYVMRIRFSDGDLWTYGQED